MTTTFTLHAIGTVRSPQNQMSQGGWARIESTIEIAPEYVPGLKRLADFSHVIVTFALDRALFDPAQHLHRRPRGQADAPELGVFAQRTKYRPNPIGITTVELLGITGGSVRVRGLDALDGTPVLDLKPYIPMFDRVESPRVPEWVGIVMDGYF
jgi:tRNA-Thr(GGU) m(6)t(6)A37 methyltransferase TsaA